MAVDRPAQTVGLLRLLSGAAFLVSPLRANRLWGVDELPAPAAQLLMRSMGYRDALIGAMLFAAATRGCSTRGWFLASAGADAADLIGALSVRQALPRKERITGIVGALAGCAVGLWGASRGEPRPTALITSAAAQTQR